MLFGALGVKMLKSNYQKFFFKNIGPNRLPWMASLGPRDAVWLYWTSSSLVCVIACHLLGTKPYWLIANSLGTNFSLTKKQTNKNTLLLTSPLCHIYASSNRVSIGSDNGLSVPNHYLKQGLDIVNSTLRNKLQWNFNQNKKLFHPGKCIWKCCLQKGSHFVQGAMS